MSEAALIERIAARGDGVTGDGRHVAGGVPGDRVRDDGIIIPGPNRTDPVCRHFGKCGGCQLQHVAEPALAEFVRDRVVGGLEGQEVPYGDVLPAQLSPPRSRRRAALNPIATCLPVLCAVSAARRRLCGGERSAGSTSP